MTDTETKQFVACMLVDLVEVFVEIDAHNTETLLRTAQTKVLPVIV